MWNIVPEPTLQLRMCKGKCEDHMPEVNLRRTRKVITEVSNFASHISTKPGMYLFSNVSV